MSAVLAVSLSPGLALASTLEAGQAATGKVLTPQAKKSVYVLDTVSYTYSGSSYTYVEVGDGNGDYNYDEEEHDYVYVGEGKGAYSYQSQPYTETTVTSYKYNSGGLLTNMTSHKKKAKKL